MKILALNPFHTGSHQAFIEGWKQHSRHDIELMTLPGRHWKWRMRHAALTLSRQIERLPRSFDLLFTTSMLDLAALQGLLLRTDRVFPTVIYFHENQFSYPTRFADVRDLQLAYTNFLSACSATEVWFNSGFHQWDFATACRKCLTQFPDYQHLEDVDRVARKSHVVPPGIELGAFQECARIPGPLRIAWVSRWEHDKNPADFFRALGRLASLAIPFRLIVLGESFREKPREFQLGHDQFSSSIDHWGYVQSPSEYRQWLARADVVVSTARHEFFGIAILEAMAAGCIPLLPDRLSYPEITGGNPSWLYSGTWEALAERLADLSQQITSSPRRWQQMRREACQRAEQYAWENSARGLDRRAELTRDNGR